MHKKLSIQKTYAAGWAAAGLLLTCLRVTGTIGIAAMLGAGILLLVQTSLQDAFDPISAGGAVTFLLFAVLSLPTHYQD